MKYRTLCLILAAGKGERIQHLLQPEEHTKPMIKIDNRHIIDYVIDEAKQLNGNVAVLSYADEQHKSLDELMLEYRVPVLYQAAPRWKMPSVMEIPWILIGQYHRSKDKDFLQQYDSMMVFTADTLFKDIAFSEMLELHNNNMKTSSERQVTLLSKQSDSGDELFKVDDAHRILAWITGKKLRTKKYSKPYSKPEKEFHESFKRYESPPGIYIISKGLLSRPWMLLCDLKQNRALMYETSGSWIDCGVPENLIKLRQGEYMWS